MNNDLSEVIQKHPELLRMMGTYFLGFLAIAVVGWFCVYRRVQSHELRQADWVGYPMPFTLGLGFFLVMLSSLFILKSLGMIGVMMVVGGCFFFLMSQSGRSFSQVMGVDRYSTVKIVCAGLGITAMTFGPAYIMAWLNGILCLIFKIQVEPQTLIYQFIKMDSPQAILGFILIATVAAPFTEEILFRGMFYPVLRDRFGILMAALISGITFGAIHLHFPTFLPLSLLGVVLALAYEFSGSLLLSMVIHAIFNLFTVLNLLLLKPYLPIH